MILKCILVKSILKCEVAEDRIQW